MALDVAGEMTKRRKLKAVSWDDDLLARVEAAAAAQGVTFSEWVRAAAIAALHTQREDGAK
jgi:hypothetical protein